MGFLGGEEGPWREDGQKSENEQDPSQVESPTEDGYSPAVVSVDDNTPYPREQV
jgi:hypothetical protein